MDRKNMTVLLVEDNPGDARIMKELLGESSRAPCVLHQVDRLASAVEFLSRHSVELILLDLSLPDGQGMQGFREIHQAAPETAIIILTGLNQEDLAMRAMQEGAQDYLVKGCGLEGLLVKAIHYAVARKKDEVALRKAHDSLEARVQVRTAELARINDELRNEIVERTRVERALRASEARYRAIVEDQTELIFRILADQTITFVNGAFGRFLSRKPHELLGKNLRELIAESEADQIREHLAALTETGTVRMAEQLFHTTDGGQRWVQWTSRLIPDSSHDTPEYQWVGRDITEQKCMEEALQKSACDMKRFAYFVAHDLKSPAVGLHGLVRLLKKNSPDGLNEKAKAYCEQISRSAEQIVALVDSINFYITAKENPLMVEDVDLAEVCGTLRQEFSTRLQARQVTWSQPEALPVIRADRLGIVRTLRNLVDNALKYGGEDLREIKLGYTCTDTEHILSVSDDGVGVDEQDLERIFGLFERKIGGERIEGAGLGLAIVKEIVEKHGGRVWVEPEKKGITIHASVARNL